MATARTPKKSSKPAATAKTNLDFTTPNGPFTLRAMALTVVLVLLVAWVFVALSEILLPFVVGVVLAYMLNPLVSHLNQAGLPRPLAAALPVMFAITLIGGALFLGLPLLLEQVSSFAARLPDYLSALERYVMPERFGFGGIMDVNFDLRSVLRQLGLLSSKGAAITAQALQQTLNGALWLFNVLLLVIMTPLVAFYLLMDWPGIMRGSLAQLPKRWHNTVKEVAHDIDIKLAAYLRGTFLVCLIMGCFYALALNMVGPLASHMTGYAVAPMELAVAIGLLTGFLAFLPVIGASIGVLMMVSVALVQYQLQILEPYALLLGIFVIGQTLEGYVMTPLLVGNRVGLHPLWVIFALLAGGALAGILGMLAALPVAVIVSVILPRLLAAWRESVG